MFEFDELNRRYESERRLRRMQAWLILGALFAMLLLLAPWGLLRRWSDGDVAPRAVTPRGELAPVEATQVEIFERVSPSVVFITTLSVRQDLWLNTLKAPSGTGTGFLWSEQGHVVTNLHVVEGVQQVEVALADGRVFSAQLVGAAPDKDLAVLKINAPDAALPPIPIGTSADLKVGQNVYAIGNPFGLDHTMTSGIVSALGREIQAANGRAIEGVIQTDAAINPGNSGGPLLDSAGRLIGVNTAILSETGSYTGIGFAVPVDTVNRVVQQLIEHGRYQRPTLGVQLAPAHVAARLGVDRGVLVLRVVPGSGAEAAGLRGTQRIGRDVILGDILLAIDGDDVADLDGILNALERHEPGDTVPVELLRDGASLTLEVQLSP